VRIALLGDVMLGRLVNEALRAVPPEYPWGDTLPILRAANAVIANLECVLSDRGAPQPGKTFTFRSDPANIAVLQAAGVCAVSLANNHSLDYGPQALLDCLAVLEGAGIAAAGAGRSLEAAASPVTVPVRGARPGTRDGPAIALVAWTDNEPGWEAGPQTPGTFFVPLTPDGDDPREHRLVAVVADAARRGQFVIVSAHWGPNWGPDPLPEHVRAARRLIDAGAAVVFGHSPHVFRGVELYRGRPIFYSCGDVIDDYLVDGIERNDLSGVSILDFEGDRLQRLRVYPTIIRRFQARIADGEDRRIFLDRLAALCQARGAAPRRVAEDPYVCLDIGCAPDGRPAGSVLECG
jgi:poly-gamma-glutamate synthesis protein (capsule biosynthesis protein)